MSDSFDIDPDLVRKLADLLNETGLGEIEYEDNGKRVRVALPGVGAPAVAAPVVAPAAAPVATPSTAGGDAAAHPGAVTSPMVGTVYLAQAPEDPPFVKAGDSVREGQTLLLIEAMKTFNEVKAPRTGTLQSIAVASGQPVEFGEVLAIIE
ncbi:MAG: acetyl-CoA carboxylase biotin carboxyl carrier protein [Rhodospirillaceae bacterium]|jgi:acetyl-CoA carboxylase biotin carboxyl carrier protein|nr:acetyl-CoA carboxylase biotin carboxyl carrier protein [Rhodospirillaceae bacterium]MBT5945554.1 acetyl-CoA carboxylase biotin carboxyl carrier protein [Rhodospirillaceae bacterium]MBT6404437.1 acetyl-CoA carboxylase biotin carboxyl carrier protein [Rhodospirillaceae bacterium]MBT6536418.1 acetyl-CoA carboxylase biotin carboxyl carrier protein [Rhodospirillaceae bacterium]MBT7361472.1 acetyl-CoA carboxylase biotin carboxyl carrier protein [Rhodospirillaceae bacterium]